MKTFHQYRLDEISIMKRVAYTHGAWWNAKKHLIKGAAFAAVAKNDKADKSFAKMDKRLDGIWKATNPARYEGIKKK